MMEEEKLEGWRGEPETVDVFGDQAEADWRREPVSDDQLTPEVHRRVVNPPPPPRPAPR